MMSKLANALLLGLGAIGAVWLLTSLASVVQGGDLDPPAAPGSTMQTLDDLVPSWHKVISGTDRFDEADGWVLDRETGLVWDKIPQSTTMNWEDAVPYCWNRSVTPDGFALKKGWRLPTVEELMTLVDPNASGTPKLPPNHPFNNISGKYWTSTATVGNWFEKYVWDSATSSLSTQVTFPGNRAWCVRAPGGFDNVSDAN
jgi:hypothetical protein